MKDIRPTLRQGCKAIFTSAFCGNVRCIVLSITGDDGRPHAGQSVKLRVTATGNRYYSRGSVIETTGNQCVPREAFNAKRYGAHILPYQVECDVKRDTPSFTLARAF